MGCSASVVQHPSKYRDHERANSSEDVQFKPSAGPYDKLLTPEFRFSSKALLVGSDGAMPLALGTADAHQIPQAGRREVRETKVSSRQEPAEPWDVEDLSYGPSFGPEELSADILRRWRRLPAAYVVGGTLAKTDNCEVHLAAQVSDRTKIVVKRVHKRHSAQPYPTHVNEVRCLDRLRHPCIVKLLGVIERCDALDILLEYCNGGALRNFVEEGCGSCSPLHPVLCDVISALVFMHGEWFAHLDVKPHNVLVELGPVARLNLNVSCS